MSEIDVSVELPEYLLGNEYQREVVESLEGLGVSPNIAAMAARLQKPRTTVSHHWNKWCEQVGDEAVLRLMSGYVNLDNSAVQAVVHGLTKGQFRVKVLSEEDVGQKGEVIARHGNDCYLVSVEKVPKHVAKKYVEQGGDSSGVE